MNICYCACSTCTSGGCCQTSGTPVVLPLVHSWQTKTNITRWPQHEHDFQKFEMALKAGISNSEKDTYKRPICGAVLSCVRPPHVGDERHERSDGILWHWHETVLPHRSGSTDGLRKALTGAAQDYHEAAMLIRGGFSVHDGFAFEKCPDIRCCQYRSTLVEGDISV